MVKSEQKINSEPKVQFDRGYNLTEAPIQPRINSKPMIDSKLWKHSEPRDQSDLGLNPTKDPIFPKGPILPRVQYEVTFQRSLPRSPNAQLHQNIEISSLFALSLMLAYS